MARISDDVIARLKQEVSVQRLAEARGVELKKHGTELVGICPFHTDDSEPNLVINPQQNTWNCAVCQTGGTCIEWVMGMEGISFRHSVELLREDHLPTANRNGKPPQKSTTPKLPPPVSRDADDRVLLLEVIRFYNQTLKESPEALRYLEGRGLRSSEIIDHFQLGFANRTLGYRLPEKNRVAGAEIRGRLQKLGILRDTGHEQFNGSVTIPIFGPDGEVVQMYGRKITPNLRPGTPLHLYMPGPHRGVWNEQALAVSKEIILCEALIDALTFWCAGFRNVTASYGVDGFTDDHRTAFRKHGIQKVFIAYDRDDAGEKAAQQVAEELLAMGIDCYRVQFPKGLDANDYALMVQPAAKSLGVLLNKAEWLGKGTRPTVAVIEAQPANEEPEATPAPPTEQQIPEAVATPPTPIVPAIDIPMEILGDEITIHQDDRRYRVRGLAKNLSYEMLKVNVLVSGTNLRGESGYHVDVMDLYSARQRGMFIKQAAEELGVKEDVIRRDLGRVLLKLEELQDQQIKAALGAKQAEVVMDEEDRTTALNLLRDPKLLDRILADFERCGMVGEQTNKLVSYLAVTSRLLESPLAIVVQASSAAGKSALMEAVLAFLPEEQRVQYSAMTGQSLFYMGESDLKHKVLAIVEEEGATRAAYALKLLQSEGAISIASTGKDSTTGRLIAQEYKVCGPVMIFLTTTAIDLDEELLNRCVVLSVDEDRTQTQAIHQKQREAQTLEGLLARQEREEVLKLHRNAQRLLKPLFVANPYARELTFGDSQTRSRRDHTKYLTLIRAVAMLFQYQRPRKTTTVSGKAMEYIEVTKEDIAIANRLAHEVLGHSLDELPPHTRRLLLLVDEMAGRECKRLKMGRADLRFSRRNVRQHTGWGNTQLRVHLKRLVELEYLLVHRGGRGQSFVYELVYERRADTDKPVLPGLIEAEKLGHGYDEKNAGRNGHSAGSKRPQNGRVAGSTRDEESPVKTRGNGDLGLNLEKSTTRGPRSEHVVVVEVPADGAGH